MAARRGTPRYPDDAKARQGTPEATAQTPVEHRISPRERVQQPVPEDLPPAAPQAPMQQGQDPSGPQQASAPPWQATRTVEHEPGPEPQSASEGDGMEQRVVGPARRTNRGGPAVRRRRPTARSPVPGPDGGARPATAKLQRTAPREQGIESKGEPERRAPGKRGGRPRVGHEGDEQQHATAKPLRTPKPDVICWKEEWQWVAAVEVPEDVLQGRDLEVLQNGSLLRKSESRNDCWVLAEAVGQVTVCCGEHEDQIDLGQSASLLFKLSGVDQGRRARSPSSGSYAVMVPKGWERDTARSGTPPVATENAALAGYRVHFFDLQKDPQNSDGGAIAFIAAGAPVVIERNGQRFELVGTTVPDASEAMGPLFGGEPPRIIAQQDGAAWKDIGSIVIGEEGSGKGRWKTQFGPVQDRIDQDLPTGLQERRGGWFFLRFYDHNDDEVESLDFRWIPALKELKVPQSPPLPAGDGHGPAVIEFLHEGCTVCRADQGTRIQPDCEDGKTTVTIPPDPACDETRWLVSSPGGPPVELTVLVERCWWAMGGNDDEPSEWGDRPLILESGDFAATSRKEVWVRLPRQRWVHDIRLGFNESTARIYDVKVVGRTIVVPLREFGDSQEMEDPTREHALRIWLKRDGASGASSEGVIAVIGASAQWVGSGRHKRAEAKAVLRPGSGRINVNGWSAEVYFQETPRRPRNFWRRLHVLDGVSDALAGVDGDIKVNRTQRNVRAAQAAVHALARALMNREPGLKPVLEGAGYGGVKAIRVPPGG